MDFRDDKPPQIISFFPNVNTNYDKPFNYHALYKPIFALFLWSVHHSLFIREPIRKLITNKFNLNDKTQTHVYRIVAAILLLYVIFSWNVSGRYIGGGHIWNVSLISSPSNPFFIRNICHLIIGIGLIYVLKEIDRLQIVRSDVIITNSVYGIVRHPAQALIIASFWITPRMTVSKFIFVTLTTIYILIGLYFEEKTLINKFGDAYVEYKKNFPALMPFGMLHASKSNNNKKQS